jgi:choline dehydrogenase-like flavoprotein
LTDKIAVTVYSDDSSRVNVSRIVRLPLQHASNTIDSFDPFSNNPRTSDGESDPGRLLFNPSGGATFGAVKDIAADKEVILAVGAINSPKLLMLSGAGEAKALRSLGIDVVENLPGVGENLQDHVLVSGVVFKYKGKMPDRPADSNAVEAEAYLSSAPSGDTDISLVPHQLPAVTPEVALRLGTPPPDAFTIAPALVQPTSKGSVRLASNNFHDAAVIGKYLALGRVEASARIMSRVGP